ncbi:MAG TPA: hypothetical protein VHB46_14475 [Burkholderiales bacterium]|nr:hypothetical protein [Burkholderiales bacterium]
MSRADLSLPLLVQSMRFQGVEEIYFLIAIEALLLIVVLIVMSSIRFVRFEQKAWIFFAYLLGVAVSAAATNHLPYIENVVLVTCVYLFVPLATWLIALAMTMRFRRKRKRALKAPVAGSQNKNYMPPLKISKPRHRPG